MNDFTRFAEWNKKRKEYNNIMEELRFCYCPLYTVKEIVSAVKMLGVEFRMNKVDAAKSCLRSAKLIGYAGLAKHDINYIKPNLNTKYGKDYLKG